MDAEETRNAKIAWLPCHGKGGVYCDEDLLVSLVRHGSAHPNLIVSVIAGYELDDLSDVQLLPRLEVPLKVLGLARLHLDSELLYKLLGLLGVFLLHFEDQKNEHWYTSMK